MGNCKFYSTKAVARMFGKDVQTIRRWIHEGKVTAKRDPGGRCWLIISIDEQLTVHNDTQGSISV